MTHSRFQEGVHFSNKDQGFKLGFQTQIRASKNSSKSGLGIQDTVKIGFQVRVRVSNLSSTQGSVCEIGVFDLLVLQVGFLLRVSVSSKGLKSGLRFQIKALKHD